MKPRRGRRRRSLPHESPPARCCAGRSWPGKKRGRRKKRGRSSFFWLLRLTAGAERVFELQANDGLSDEGPAAVGGSLLDTAANRFEFCFCLGTIDECPPLPRSRDGPVAEDAAGLGCAVRTSPETAVLPVFGPLAQRRLPWITFDVSQDREQVAVVFHRECLESALVEMPRSLGVIVGMPPHGVRVRQPAKEGGEL